MVQAIASTDGARNGLWKVAAGGVLTGLLTPLLPPLIDMINGSLGDFRLALMAAPFAVLVLILVRSSANPWWAALAAGIVTMIAFVLAVNAAIWIDGAVGDVGRVTGNILSGLGGGFVGAAVMALGMCWMPSCPRSIRAWLPMLAIGTAAGALLALDGAFQLDRFSLLYPLWQAGVAAGLALALRPGVTAPRSP